MDLSCAQVSGSRALFEFLGSPSCALEELHLLNSRLNDDVTVSVAYSLLNNRSLKTSDLSACPITMAGWRAFSLVLLDPDSALENLYLSSCEINDEAVTSIANALVNNNVLRGLKLCNNSQITTAGWKTFFSVLGNPNSALKKLDVSCNAIDGDAMMALIDSLADNESLIELQGPVRCVEHSVHVPLQPHASGSLSGERGNFIPGRRSIVFGTE